MTARWLTKLVRRSVASVYLYGLLRSAMLIVQWALHRPDEPDLWFLARIPRRNNELILDIGANGGQSAVALGFIRPAARIISFEPVSTLWPELSRVRKLLGSRFEFRKYGLGKEQVKSSLYIPISGELAITTRASISRDAALKNCRELEELIGLPTRIDTVSVEIRPGDTERLAPLAIKIDVEGAEYEVVQGLRETIDEYRPLVLLEKSESFDDCVKLFVELGYDIFTASPVSAQEKYLPGLSHRNWIACPPELTPALLTPAQ